MDGAEVREGPGRGDRREPSGPRVKKLHFWKRVVPGGEFR